MKIIIFIIFIVFIIVFLLCGENGSNHKCKDANECPASVRCTARSKKDMNCFEKK